MPRERGYGRRLLEDAPDGMALVDPETGHIRDVNERLSAMHGYSRSTLLGLPVGTLTADEWTADVPLLERIRRTADGERFTWGTEHETGDRLRVEMAVAHVERDGAARLVRVTERDETTDRTEDATLQTRAMDEAPVGISIADATQDDTPLIYANEQFQRLTGYSESDVLGRNCRFLQGDGTDDDTTARLRAAIDAAEPVTVELRNYRKDGTPFWNRVTVSPVRDDDGRVSNYVGFQRDVTDRKRQAQELKRFRQLFDRLPVGAFRVTDGGDGEFVDVNQALVSMFRAESEAALLGRDASELCRASDERSAIADRLDADGEVIEQELRLRRLDGDSFWGSVSAVLVEEAGEVYLDGVVHDVTTRKQYQQRLEAQRDGLEILNRVVRHDIRNDLQLLVAYGDLLAGHVTDEGASYLSSMSDSIDNAIDLTRTARDIAETMLRTDADPEAVALGPVLDEQVDAADSAHDTTVTVEGSVPTVQVLADEMLGSVFRNLLNNAVQHNDTDDPTVRVSVTERDDRVRVRVADDGPGIPDERKEGVFGKGQKGLDSDGTGIGLYLVHTLVEQYGGEVWIDDAEPRGAVVTVELPTAESRRQ
ncbi:PAS domain S-box protein [Halorientalis pallida]|uniref:histidine kinase n=1 Tax=Halorientalis pallida TaxID=2479928 RepID=A0A498KX68_9EURY|nr:PAS domain S-box protein [Halorientalis pallida]RXK50212.1 PAS domain S-box protein [Halorientalis pallida]